MILTFDSLNKYRIYSVDNTLVKNFHIVKFVIGIWLAIFRSVDNCVFFIPHAMYYNECPQCGAYLDPGEHCDCEEERQRQTQRIMAMVRENKESHQMELVLN